MKIGRDTEGWSSGLRHRSWSRQRNEALARGQTKAFWRQPKDDGFQEDPFENRAEYGRVVEWFKAPVLKTGVGSPPPRVRISPLPPKIKKFPLGSFFIFKRDENSAREFARE